MSLIDTAIAAANPALLSALGDEVQYTPMNPPSDAIPGRGIVTRILPGQSDPGHWANLEIDEAEFGVTAAEGDVVTVKGVDYRVKSPTRDAGLTLLRLHKKK